MESALSATEWASKSVERGRWMVWFGDEFIVGEGHDMATVPDIPALIACANFALPDTDLRKITRVRIEALRDAAKFADDDLAEAFAEALASYLPPEE